MYVFPEKECLFKMKTSAEVFKITLCLRAVCFSVEGRVKSVDLSTRLIGFYLAGESRSMRFFGVFAFTKKPDMKNRSLLLFVTQSFWSCWECWNSWIRSGSLLGWWPSSPFCKCPFLLLVFLCRLAWRWKFETSMVCMWGRDPFSLPGAFFPAPKCLYSSRVIRKGAFLHEGRDASAEPR